MVSRDSWGAQSENGLMRLGGDEVYFIPIITDTRRQPTGASDIQTCGASGQFIASYPASSQAALYETTEAVLECPIHLRHIRQYCFLGELSSNQPPTHIPYQHST